ncbi:DUF3800 domain-containing protein [Lentzea sp. NPDC055074]
MLLTYVDESFCKHCYYITALMVPEREAIALSDALDAVVRTTHDKFPDVAATAELHGYDIFQGRADWAAVARMVRVRIGVYQKALEAIAQHDVRIIIRGVDPVTLKERYSDPGFYPHSVALAQLLERVDIHAEGSEELTLVIADEPGQADQQPEYRDDLQKYRGDGGWGFCARKLVRIVDTLHFAPSRASRLLQAADLVAFLHHRIATTKPEHDQRSVKANDDLWRLISPQVIEATIWTP